MSKNFKIILAFGFFLAILIAGNVIQYKNNKRLSEERDRYKKNTEVLMTDVEHYKIQDSLNVVKVESLELTVKEYQKYRAEDAELIKQLRVKNRDLQSVITSQSQTIIDMSSAPKDTVIIRDSVMINAVAVHCGDEWYEFDGLLTEDSFEGKMVSWDSLLVAETVKYKRFLGFLWKTKNIKSRTIDVVNKNPHTTIQDCEIITIKDN